MKRVGDVVLRAGRNHQESPCARAHALAASPDTWEGSSPQNTQPALHGGACRGGKWRKAGEALEGCDNLWFLGQHNGKLTCRGWFRESTGSLHGLGSINGPAVRSWGCIRKELAEV